eukprot:GHUV01004242.1.p1 GENE.GHUV01004242.1~~GHUV01004242.1.p1  ORF type:complete len:354 (+),score=78.81 GHUV01004242.1:278-1339(+)
MKRGSQQASELEEHKAYRTKAHKASGMYQKAGLATAGVRVLTRSKARAEAAVDARSRCPDALPDTRTLVHASNASDAVSTMPDAPLPMAQLSALPPLAATTARQKLANQSQSIAVQGVTKLPVALHARVTATAHSCSKPAAQSLAHQPSDDLHQSDIMAAVNSKLVHPSLLQHPGLGAAKKQQAARGTLQPTLTASAGRSSSPRRSPSPVRRRDPATKHSGILSHDNGGCSSSSDSDHSSHGGRSSRRVSFAPGPLSPQQHGNCTPDGHPAAEGAQAVPVRRVAPSYALDLTKGNVLFLENLLGQDCQMSVMRLKRRVGLLPPIKPPRPHVGAKPGQEATSPGTPHPAAAATQ